MMSLAVDFAHGWAGDGSCYGAFGDFLKPRLPFCFAHHIYNNANCLECFHEYFARALQAAVSLHTFQSPTGLDSNSISSCRISSQRRSTNGISFASYLSEEHQLPTSAEDLEHFPFFVSWPSALFTLLVDQLIIKLQAKMSAMDCQVAAGRGVAARGRAFTLWKHTTCPAQTHREQRLPR
jgi:hypothetical protein